MKTRSMLVTAAAALLVSGCSQGMNNWELYQMEQRAGVSTMPMERQRIVRSEQRQQETAATALADGDTLIFVEPGSSEEIELRPGEQRTVRLSGSNLDELESVQITRGEQRVQGVRASLERASENEAVVRIEVSPDARPGSGYDLRLEGGDTRAPAPLRISVAEGSRGDTARGRLQTR